MIDIHSHILPGIDDGSKDIKTTLDMLKTAAKDGTKEIIATPHFYRGYGETPLEEVKKLVESFNFMVKDEGIDIHINYGQEVFCNETMVEDYKDGTIGTINGSRYLLFELPMDKFDRNTFDMIYELQILDLVPVLAHPERYKPFHDNPSAINDFINEGVLFQLNSGSIEGIWGKTVKKTAEIFLNNGIYNFIGSDAHNNERRKTGISNAVELAVQANKIYRTLFDESAEKMLNNQEIEFIGHKIKEKKGLFGLFSKKR